MSKKITYKFVNLKFLDDQFIFPLQDTLYKYINVIFDSAKRKIQFKNIFTRLEDSSKIVIFEYKVFKSWGKILERFFLSVDYVNDSVEYRINLVLKNNIPVFYYAYKSPYFKSININYQYWSEFYELKKIKKLRKFKK